MAKEKNITRTQWVTGLIVTFACCTIYACFFSFRTLPISEGWYSEYSWQINHGNLPYKDFEYLFFPLYLFIIAGYTRIFGYGILALRILGVVVFGVTSIVIYAIISKVFDNLSATIASVMAMLYLQSEVAQVYYDYIRFHDLFALITIYLLVITTSFCVDTIKRNIFFNITHFLSEYIVPATVILTGILGLINYNLTVHPKKSVLFIVIILIGIGLFIVPKLINKSFTMRVEIPFTAILCGCFVAMECMIKQSNGILMLVFILIYFLFCLIVFKEKTQCYVRFRDSFAGVVYGIVFSFMLLLMYLVVTKSLNEFVQCCFVNALSAKGGLAATLFGWIPSTWSSFLHERAKAILLVLIVFFSIKYCISQNNNYKRYYKSLYVMLCGLSILLIIFISVKNPNFMSLDFSPSEPYMPSLAFYLCTIAFFVSALYMCYAKIRKKEINKLFAEYFIFPILGAVFAQGYGCGMSGGLATSQTALGLAVLISASIHFILQTKMPVLLACMALYLIPILSAFAGSKVTQTYSWWGLAQNSLDLHTETIDVPLLQGIKVREMDAVCYETIYNDIINNTDENDTIFTFPHCPIFYTITDRHSVTYSKVQWFDVSSDYSISRDIESLESNLPRIIIYVDVPEFVYEGHESSFSTYQTRKMQNYLLQLTERKYRKLHSLDLGNGYTISSYLLYE